MSGAFRGWIPAAERTFAQQMLSEWWEVATPRLKDVCGESNVPEQVLLYSLEVQANGRLCNRIWQQEGSCVGAAAARSYVQSMCGDFVHRATQEAIVDICPWPTWGIGRRIGGLHSRGGGSFGAAQAEACKEWGLMAASDARLDQPRNVDGWLVWTAKTELDWSVPRHWPVAEDLLRPVAAGHQVSYVARIRDLNELHQAFVNGYGVTIASTFGTSPVVRNGYLVGDWNKTWAHQMSLSGFITVKQATPQLAAGRLYAVDNQWGPAAHKCPYLTKLGVSGSFWITEKTLSQIMGKRDTEVFAHGNTEDFPRREIDWGTLGMK